MGIPSKVIMGLITGPSADDIVPGDDHKGLFASRIGGTAAADGRRTPPPCQERQ